MNPQPRRRGHDDGNFRVRIRRGGGVTRRSVRVGKPRPLWLELDRIAEQMKRAPSLFVACDFDGTLTQIVRLPDLVVFTPRARDALVRIAGLPNTQVAVLSGRVIDDLAENVALPGVFLSGQAGIETQDATGERETHVKPGNGIPGELRAELEEWCGKFPGAWVEDKVQSFAVHYRAVAASRQRGFVSGVRRRARPFENGVSLVHGKCIFEVMPPGERNKASALERWLGPDLGERMVFYFGDDTNDEPALAWVRSRGGFSVTVGRSSSCAEFALPDPRDVIWFLEWLGREWRARSEPVVPEAPAPGAGPES